MVCFVLVGCVLLLKFALLVGDFVCIGGVGEFVVICGANLCVCGFSVAVFWRV